MSFIEWLSIKKDMMDMYRKNKQRIKKAGLSKEKAEQKRWAKNILKTKNIEKIILDIESQGFSIDEEQQIKKVLLKDILFKGIFIVVEKEKNWGIEINSNLPNLDGVEYLKLLAPLDRQYYFVRKIQ
jgi:hypothetical protein